MRFRNGKGNRMAFAGRAAAHWIAALLAGWMLASCAHAPAAEEAAPPPHASFTLDSAALHETRRINVYLPPAQAPDRRHPVVYMLDGGVAEDFPHVANIIDAAIRAGRMAPVILVGIENTQRRRDLTGPTSVAEDREIAPVVGGSAQFRAFIADELIPRIEAAYPASGRRGLIGESLAGLFVLETLSASPELFDTWIALDPSLWWNDGRLAADAPTWLAAHPHARGRLYVGWAEPETIGPNVGMLERALANAPAGLAWRVVARPDLDHGTIYRALAPEVLPAMYPPE